MKLSDRYDIYVDFTIKNNLCEYFNCRDIKFDFIAQRDGLPLIDSIKYKASKDKKILLIISVITLGKLLLEKSKYNNSLEDLAMERIKIIIKKDGETLNYLYNNLMHQEYNLSELEMEDKGFTDLKNLEMAKQFNITVLSDGIAGVHLRSTFPNWNFVYTDQIWIGLNNYHHLFHISKTNTERDRTFFCLMRFQTQFRDHRKWLWQEIENKKYINDSIVKLTEGSRPTFNDLKGHYGDIWLDGTKWYDGVPNQEYYQRTCFELTSECLGHHPTDDSFYITEKTLKPIMMRHPFIIMAPKNHLKNLRSMGFKTFDSIIDETYDEIDDGRLRANAISTLLDTLDLEKSKRFYEESQEICKFNQDHLLTLHGRYQFDLWSNFENFFDNYR